MTAETINRILGITEAYKMPDVLLEKLLNDEIKTDLFNRFLEEGEPLSQDWFNEYYQTEHGDRNNLKQDFTPDCVCKIATEMLNNNGTFADICAGTGSLTLKEWQRGTKEYYLTELAARAIPVLLFNLSIRNIKATVYNANALSREVFRTYKLTPGQKYSRIEIVDVSMDYLVDSVIMNPPYSLKWEYEESRKDEERFSGYSMPPKSKSDFAFVLEGISRLKDGGSLVCILPHGVLFRGNREGEIRKKLIENDLLDTVIGLPDNLFFNTGIPVCILKFTKNRENKGILFIDASKEYVKDGKTNNMTGKNIDTVLAAIKMRRNIDKLSYLASPEEIERNDYNLNIPRYVDTFEPPEPVDIVGECKKLYEIRSSIKELDKQIYNTLNDLAGDAEFEKAKEIWRQYSEMC